VDKVDYRVEFKRIENITRRWKKNSKSATKHIKIRNHSFIQTLGKIHISRRFLEIVNEEIQHRTESRYSNTWKRFKVFVDSERS